MIDSGTTLSYFPNDIYNDILSYIRQYCKRFNKCMGELFKSDLGHCFKLNKNINTIQFIESMPVLTFEFKGNNDNNDNNEDETKLYTWKPSNYLFNYTTSNIPTYCFGGVSWGRSDILLGTTWMHDHDIIFDMEKNRIGFVESACDGGNTNSNNKINTVVVYVNLKCKLFKILAFCLFILVILMIYVIMRLITNRKFLCLKVSDIKDSEDRENSNQAEVEMNQTKLSIV